MEEWWSRAGRARLTAWIASVVRLARLLLSGHLFSLVPNPHSPGEVMYSFSKSALTRFGLLGALTGCSTVAPTQLTDARTAYTTSAEGQAGKLTPTDVYEAKKALDQANQEFDAHGDTSLLRDFAYIAQRKAELADVKAQTEADRLRIADAQKQGVVVRDNQALENRAALADVRGQLKDERNANNLQTSQLVAANTAQGKQLDQTSAQLDAEKAARMSAEAKLAGAMKDLATIAAVKEDSRGVVITLSGSVLFASGKFALLETAKTKLTQVAEALKAQSPDKQITVEGHTDSQGSDATNQPLSLNRATAVQEYLVACGVDANRIRAVGMGSSKPIVDNNTAENRANNRRVEIVIKPTAGSAN